MNFRLLWCAWAALAVLSPAFTAPFSTNGNRLAYLDSDDPFYVGRDFPKLITPQWVGEPGVDAVVILAIDDMRNNEPRYETVLRPILDRLKKIDGRAPVSIMVNQTSPTNELVQKWLKEGVSLEVHSISHPCPLCQQGDFNFAATNFHNCVDLLNTIPGNHPVAFRMPCCDSMNSPSPRFYSEIFNRTSPRGNFLGIDSSVMLLLTTNDPALPRELVLDPDGRERFRKYLPTATNATTRVSMGSFTTTIEDYPYPYVIGKTCWEFPCIVPSDWEANNLHAPNNPKTVEDWERALDAIVIKQGVMTFIFHPHGWIKPEQMVGFIDYAVSKYGPRVKFLNFKEAQERLNKNIGEIRGALTLVDLNNDGLLDALGAGSGGIESLRNEMRVWKPGARNWETNVIEFWSGHFFFNGRLQNMARRDALAGHLADSTRFGIIANEVVAFAPTAITAWRFDGDQWQKDYGLWSGNTELQLRLSLSGVRLRDIDGDGVCELLLSNPSTNAIFKWNSSAYRWDLMPFALPPGTSIVDAQGRDAGLRFVDVDGDGYDDVIFSNAERYSLHLFRKDSRDLRLKPGWSDEIVSGLRVNGLTDPIPPIVRDGTNRNNGAWFKDGTMWIQNEDTASLPDKVDRRTFQQLLASGQPRAMSPEDSLRAMRARPGFRVELVASEPLIRDPIAFDWSADGRLWVLEMSDYPLGVDGHGAPGGRLRILEDTDGDGRYDKATTFLDQLSCPEGFQLWRNGAVVIAGKDLFYAEDTNGDGAADVREVLFTGFSEGNQQHRANGFTYGLDSWLYGANGESDGNVRAAGAGALTAAVNIRGQDFRFDPDHRRFEAIGGRSQYGLYRDDFGNWFGNNNSVWLWHHYFPVPYLSRNPLLPLKATKRTLANYPESTRCFPISRTLSRFNDPYAAGHVTSGNSPGPYRDELFGTNFATSIFISEPVHNLVHREVLEPDGVSFKSHRAADETNSEFLASGDNWFRPTMLKTGPDGALYVADMYRLVIEHPQWIPLEMQKRLDLRAGSDLGRIYRVLPEGASLGKIPNLAKLNDVELGDSLLSPNGWVRDTAQRLLIERAGESAVPRIQLHALAAKDEKSRIQALWTLRGMKALTYEIVNDALKSSNIAVREHAIRLSEMFLNAGIHGTPSQLQPASTRNKDAGESRYNLARDLLRVVSDPSLRLRYQLAFTLGEWNDPRAADALLKLLHDSDENVRNAALSSAPRHAAALARLVESLPPTDAARTNLAMFQKLAAHPPVAAQALKVIDRTAALTPEQKAERAQVLARYADVPQLRGDAKAGLTLFEKNCAQCHRSHGQGADVGPDLGAMIGKPTEQLVEAILNPNAAVEMRFVSYSATLKNGHETGGIIISETPTTLTLRAPNRLDETLLRSDLKELSTSGLSLMPEGLEAAFTPQQLADLIAFVSSP